MQEGLQKAYEARMGLIAQQQDLQGSSKRVMYCEETELVKEEFDSIEERLWMLKLACVWTSQLKCGRMKAFG